MSGYNADRAAGNEDRPPHGAIAATDGKVAMVVYVPAALKIEVRVAAVRAGKNMSEWVEALIRREFGNDEAA